MAETFASGNLLDPAKTLGTVVTPVDRGLPCLGCFFFFAFFLFLRQAMGRFPQSSATARTPVPAGQTHTSSSPGLQGRVGVRKALSFKGFLQSGARGLWTSHEPQSCKEDGRLLHKVRAGIGLTASPLFSNRTTNQSAGESSLRRREAYSPWLRALSC